MRTTPPLTTAVHDRHSSATKAALPARSRTSNEAYEYTGDIYNFFLAHWVMTASTTPA